MACKWTLCLNNMVPELWWKHLIKSVIGRYLQSKFTFVRTTVWVAWSNKQTAGGMGIRTETYRGPVIAIWDLRIFPPDESRVLAWLMQYGTCCFITDPALVAGSVSVKLHSSRCETYQHCTIRHCQWWMICYLFIYLVQRVYMDEAQMSSFAKKRNSYATFHHSSSLSCTFECHL